MDTTEFPNVDDMEPGDLISLLVAIGEVREFVALTMQAKTARLNGSIAKALDLERMADFVRDGLPAWARQD